MKIRFYAGGLLLLAALGLTGCSTVEAPPQHVVLVNHSGQSLYLTGPKARKPESTNDFDQHLAASPRPSPPIPIASLPMARGKS